MSAEKNIAKIAVAAAPYWIDRPFGYLIPDGLTDTLRPGMRVTVPFGKGNRRSEGFVLKITSEQSAPSGVSLKAIESAADTNPVVSPEQIKLALRMRERFFCTVYSALNAMLPAGMRFRDGGARRVNDKTAKFIELAVSAEEAADIARRNGRSARVQAELLNVLRAVGRVSVYELRQFTGSSSASVNALVKKGLAVFGEEEVFRRPVISPDVTLPLPELTAEQNAAYTGLRGLLEASEAKAALLFGVTGSGKTAVYTRLIADTLNSNKSAILLVPEIALTPQMIEAFSARFGDTVAVLHSSLGIGERYDEYKRVRNGAARVIIGTRSAVFAPAENLGIIIIDEEQETSYRSENEPRYHATDVAKYRCAEANALLLLGSATPSLGSMYAAKTGKYAYFALNDRYNDMAMPEVRVVDMKRELRAGLTGSVSSVLRDEIAKNIESKQQSILFINRRGASKLITCADCGFTYGCPSCSVSLTYHSSVNRLLCHYCGHSRAVGSICPDCGGRLKFIGDGTQRIVEELSELFPDTEILRLDLDTVSAAGSHEKLLSRFRDEKIPVMVGTQMVTKGLNFENVTLVGVISADSSLYAGDYRSAERTFSLLTQVIGRSGRGSISGRAVIQTFNPENETILCASRQDYAAFYEAEIKLREIQGSPPFAELYALTVTGAEEQTVLRACHGAKRLLLETLPEGAAVLGPAPLRIVRVSDRYRYRVSVISADGKAAERAIERAIEYTNTEKAFRGVLAFGERDPSDF